MQTILFQRLGLSDVNSRIVAACNGTEYFLASLIAIFIIERVGRRRLMLYSAFGQTITMVLLAILGSINNSAAQVASCVLLFVFNSIFALGWLGMTWLYVRAFSGLQFSLIVLALSSLIAACRNCRTTHKSTCKRSQHGVQLDFQLHGRNGHWSFLPEHIMGDLYW